MNIAGLWYQTTTPQTVNHSCKINLLLALKTTRESKNSLINQVFINNRVIRTESQALVDNPDSLEKLKVTNKAL